MMNVQIKYLSIPKDLWETNVSGSYTVKYYPVPQ